MKSRFLFLLLMLLFISSPGAFAQQLDSRDILDHVDDLFRGHSSYGTSSMKVVTSHYSREMTLEAWSKDKDYTLIRILKPLKEKDTATLKAGNNIWNYLPKVNRVIKVPSSMMGGSWMGSHFTNDDLVKESRMADDYTYEITFQGEKDGKSIIELTLLPRPDAAVVWGKVTVCVRQDDWMPLTLDYFDEQMVKKRTMSFSDIKELGGRTLPARLRMIPTDKPGEYTEFIYLDIDFNLGLENDFFSLRNLKK